MGTTNLGMTQVATEQDSTKIATINGEMVDLDSAIAGYLPISIAGGAGDTPLSRTQTLNKFIKLTGAITGARTTSIPATGGFNREQVFWNATTGAFTVGIRIGTGTALLITQGKARLITHDGTTVYSVGPEFTPATGAISKAGTTTNDNAAAGDIGEYVEGSLASGSATSLTTATGKTITSISLTAGDWDVSGQILFTPAATTVTNTLIAQLSLSDNGASIGLGAQSRSIFAGLVSTLGYQQSETIGRFRISLNATTTIYIVGYAEFTTSTMTAYGILSARRVR